ncbi:MAG TPA: DUF2780 domain-containing protein [Polyangia bacterium]
MIRRCPRGSNHTVGRPPGKQERMDLINNVTTALGIDATSAKGAVGSVFQLLKQQSPADTFAEVEAKVPEANGWMASAPAVGGTSGGGGLGGLGGAAAALGGLGGLGESLAQGAGPIAGLVATLGKLGIGSEGIGKLVPLVLQFVQARAGEGLVGRLLSASPALAQLVGKSGGSPLAGLGGLGGLFK